MTLLGMETLNDSLLWAMDARNMAIASPPIVVTQWERLADIPQLLMRFQSASNGPYEQPRERMIAA